MKKPWLADFMYRPPSTKTILVQEPLVISQNMGWDRHFSSFFEAPIETFEKKHDNFNQWTTSNPKIDGRRWPKCRASNASRCSILIVPRNGSWNAVIDIGPPF